MHEDVRGCDALKPGGRDDAVKQCHCESHGAFAVRDYVNLVRRVPHFANFLQCGFDIETRVESCISLFGEESISDTVCDNEDLVPSRSEIFYGIAADGR